MTKLNLGLLKKARKNRNLTTQEVGSILHRDKNTIWRWETKGDFSIKTLCKLLDLYEITPMDVFVRTQEDINMVIFDANRLRELRKKNSLKQEEVACMLGCSTSMISRWELGSTPITADKLARLIEIYHDENIADFFIQTYKGEHYE